MNYFHKVFISLKTYTWPLLIFGLAIWVYCPILGIVPLLLVAQIRVSQKANSKNIRKKTFLSITSFCVFISLITLSIYASTQEILSDLEANLNIYSELNKAPFFETMASTNSGTEPISFIIPSIVKMIAGKEDKIFLLTQAFTLNLSYILLSILFLPEYYPIIILLNISSTNYFLHLFLMRQYYSYIFLIPLFFIDPLRPKAFSLSMTLAILSIFTHSSSILFSFPVIIFRLFRLNLAKIIGSISQSSSWFKDTQITDRIYKALGSRYVLLIAAIVIFVALPGALSFAGSSSQIASLAPVLSERASRYLYIDSNFIGISDNFWKGIHLVDAFLIILSLFLINFKKINNICYSWIFVFVLVFLYFLAYFFLLPGFGRITLLFSGLTGFFYAIPLYSGKMVGKLNAFVVITFSAILLKSSIFYYRIISSSYDGSSYWWNGRPFNASLLEYLTWIVHN